MIELLNINIDQPIPVFNLGVNGGQIVETITGRVATVLGTVSVSDQHVLNGNDGSIYFPGNASSYLSFSHFEDLTLGDDFTVEWVVKLEEFSNSANERIAPIVHWSDIAVSGRSANIDLFYGEGYNQLVLSTNVSTVSNRVVLPLMESALSGQSEHWAIVRKDGVTSTYRNRVRIHQTTEFVTPVENAIVRDFHIGRRAGGSTGNVLWWFK